VYKVQQISFFSAIQFRKIALSSSTRINFSSKLITFRNQSSVFLKVYFFFFQLFPTFPPSFKRKKDSKRLEDEEEKTSFSCTLYNGPLFLFSSSRKKQKRLHHDVTKFPISKLEKVFLVQKIFHSQIFPFHISN